MNVSTVLLAAATCLLIFDANAQLGPPRADDGARKAAAPGAQLPMQQGGAMSMNPNAGKSDIELEMKRKAKEAEAKQAKMLADQATNSIGKKDSQAGSGGAADPNSTLNKSAEKEAARIKKQQEDAAMCDKSCAKDEALLNTLGISNGAAKKQPSIGFPGSPSAEPTEAEKAKIAQDTQQNKVESHRLCIQKCLAGIK